MTRRWRQKSSLNHGLTWALWGHPGLPHTRLDFTVVDEEALHHSSAMRKGQEAAPAAAQAERAKMKKCGKAKEGVGVTGISLQLNGRFGRGLDMLLRKLAWYQRPIGKAACRDGGRPLQEWLSLLKPWLRTYGKLTRLLMLCCPFLWDKDRLEHASINRITTHSNGPKGKNIKTQQQNLGQSRNQIFQNKKLSRKSKHP